VGSLQLTLAAAILWPRKEASGSRTLSRSVDTGWGALVGAASTAIGIGGGAYTTVYMLHGPRKALRDALAAATSRAWRWGACRSWGSPPPSSWPARANRGH
jgi:hypothetical protein